MILNLAVKYRLQTAWSLFFIFYGQLIAPMFAAGHTLETTSAAFAHYSSKTTNEHSHLHSLENGSDGSDLKSNLRKEPFKATGTKKNDPASTPSKINIGGPSSPEASSFKAVGSDNLVNLFTGDFSYSIPLLDVGGYPVNLFYSGGVSMDQEASWVGLGWNINPGTVSRNMRGVPDDFNGTDLLTQEQNLKPNRTWGGEIGVDGEVIGIKRPNLTLSLGFSYNNYLGPALEIGANSSLGLINSVAYEKSAPASLGLDLTLSSRSGLTFSPSLNANAKLFDGRLDVGVGLSTSYNSRTGIKDLTISSQTSLVKSGRLDNAILSGLLSKLRLGSSISFAKPTYIPTLRIPMENSYTVGKIEIGGGLFGLRGAVTGNGYYSESRVAPESRKITKPLVGFMYSELATTNKDAVMDFNRINDAEVTPNTPVVSAPQYAYDIFSIQGEGTGGSIRAYRGELGYMRDNATISKDKSLSIGVDFAPGGHFGGNWNTTSAPTRVGGWDDINNTLSNTLAFKANQPGNVFENVYFKNPGEATVTSDTLINRIGGDNLVRFKLSGSNVTPRLESSLEMFNKKTGSIKGNLPLSGAINMQSNRDKRTQVITMLTANEASQVGLEKEIRNYTGAFDIKNNIVYDSIARVGLYRKAHHISEIDVLEQNGMRYVYGLPVYSVTQKDFTFSVENIPASVSDNLVSYDTTLEAKVNSKHMTNSSKIDGYVQTQETPAYASSFLLTGLLSPDFVDVKGDGITEDDLGQAVKFNYGKSTDLHKWRTPRKNIAVGVKDLAHFNEGLRSEKKDNKATISYGEREMWYLNSIESKSMVAIFKTSSRNDAKGVKSQLDGSINAAENANKKLSQIDLYTKAEIKAKGIANAKPLKSVFFVYGYGLCSGTPDNASGGKLTLKSVYFTYNGQVRNNKERYVFNYGDTTTVNAPDNPVYNYNYSDRWGSYKAPSSNPSGLSNIDFPYADTSKVQSDKNAGAWNLKKILLPSGGQMEVQYEADDYAYVQDRRACNMFKISGLGKDSTYALDSSIYKSTDASFDNYFVYVQLPKPVENTEYNKRRKEIYTKYLEGINQLAFKLIMKMPKGPEPLTVYANYDEYGLCTGRTDMIYLKLRAVDGKSPLANAAIGFLSGNLPGQAFPGYEADISNLGDFINLAGTMLTSLKDAFKDVDAQMRSDGGKARSIVMSNSFIRLNNPARIKYGGGGRVKRVMLKDNWNKMTKQYNSTYGQDYDYTTTEKAEGKDIIISSGVASYEPSIGSEENPFREILSFNNRLPLASAQYGAIEMPILEGLYPSPLVGYSKVTVRSIHRKGTHNDSTLRSAIGRQVTEFYTARQYPSFSSYTTISSMDYKKNPFFSFLYKEIINRRTLSQGFLVETNDMHGKMKFQAAYSESDEKTPISASYHTYKNTGKNGLNDKVDFVYNDQGGVIKKGNMGVDIELMTDVREFRLQSDGTSNQVQVDLFPFAFIVIPVFTMFPVKTYQENLYRAVTCTKLINYHAIEDSVVVMDKGSVISTKTLVYDAETGTPVITRTANEFNDSIFNVSYPAHWAYSSTGLAYKNIGMKFTGVNFYDGKITSGVSNQNIFFESGDELYITNNPNSYIQGTLPTNCIPASPNVFKLWAYDKNKNTTALTVPVKDLVFLDSIGRPYTNSAVSFTIVRSGKRNNLGLTVGSVTCMKSPIQNGKLLVNSTSNVVTAAAVDYKEKWQNDNDVIVKRRYYTPVCSLVELDSIECIGIIEKKINPYLKGLLGNFKPYRNYTFYANRIDSNVAVATAIRKNGYLNAFSNYWDFNVSNNLVPDVSSTKWVWNSELTAINAKGQELETRDALNRYTAAQYGFNKNFPVALVQNAKFGEAFNEGFEDYNYVESINPIKLYDCNNRYIDFNGVASIINTDTSASIKAHSGKYALKVNANTTAIKSLVVQQAPPNAYNFNFRKDTAKTLNVVGGNYKFVSNTGTYSAATTATFGNPNVTVNVYPSSASTTHYYSVYDTSYILVPTQQTYNCTIQLTTTYANTTTSPGYNNAMQVQIFDINDNKVSDMLFSKPITTSVGPINSYSVILCPGIYKIVGTISEFCQQPTNPSSSTNAYLWTCSVASSNYKSLSTVNGCISTKPIAGSDTMINPVFYQVPGKRMQFSAWVRQSCGIPCTDSNYIKSDIQIWSGGALLPANVNKVTRTGNIIEGWQKVEGEFTLPANATTAEIRFINANTQPMYVDDIRIHPFSANMKSYVYDPRTLKLSAELDENNYASFYEYDEEGQLVRVKKETIQGIKTIKETRSAKQKIVTDIQ